MKWLLTAEYGGTGGQKVEGGMVLEEPDIEIGAGVSSKAMSKRVMPETGSQGTPKRQRDDSGQRREKNKRQNVATPPAVPGFGGFGLPGQPTYR